MELIEDIFPLTFNFTYPGLLLLGFEIYPGYKSSDEHKSLLYADEILCCNDNYEDSISRFIDIVHQFVKYQITQFIEVSFIYFLKTVIYPWKSGKKSI